MKPTYLHDEAASYLGISARSLDELIHTGELPGAKIGLQWVFRLADLDAYLTEQVRVQTAARREAWSAGRMAKVKTAVSEARCRKSAKPDLSKYDEQLSA